MLSGFLKDFSIDISSGLTGFCWLYFFGENNFYWTNSGPNDGAEDPDAPLQNLVSTYSQAIAKTPIK